MPDDTQQQSNKNHQRGTMKIATTNDMYKGLAELPRPRTGYAKNCRSTSDKVIT